MKLDEGTKIINIDLIRYIKVLNDKYGIYLSPLDYEETFNYLLNNKNPKINDLNDLKRKAKEYYDLNFYETYLILNNLKDISLLTYVYSLRMKFNLDSKINKVKKINLENDNSKLIQKSIYNRIIRNIKIYNRISLFLHNEDKKNNYLLIKKLKKDVKSLNLYLTKLVNDVKPNIYKEDKDNLDFIKINDKTNFNEILCLISRIKKSNSPYINIYVTSKKIKRELIEGLKFFNLTYNESKLIKDYFLIKVIKEIIQAYINKDIGKFNENIKFINKDFLISSFKEISNFMNFLINLIKNIKVEELKINDLTNELNLINKINEEFNLYKDILNNHLETLVYYLENDDEINPYYIYKDNRINILYFSKYNFLFELGNKNEITNYFIGMDEPLFKVKDKKFNIIGNTLIYDSTNDNSFTLMNEQFKYKDKLNEFIKLIKIILSSSFKTTIFYSLTEEEVKLIKLGKEITLYKDLIIKYLILNNEIDQD